VTENMSQPVFVVVDQDASAVGMLVSDLECRFAADYRVVGKSSPAAALDRLSALREAGDQVALIICYEPMQAMPGSELLARSRSAHLYATPGDARRLTAGQVHALTAA
jgi:CheY-like chemotaxis protein